MLSSRPPSPTSTTAISAPREAKSAKAMAVVASKKVAPCSSMSGRSFAVHIATASSGIGTPSTRMRSRNDTTCGRGVQADLPSHLTQCRRDEAGDAALAVGPAHVDRGDHQVRVADGRQQRPGGIEAELDAW